jgi:hypothetical protein
MSHRVGKLSQTAAIAAAIWPTLFLTLGHGHSVTNDEFYIHLLWASRLLKGLLFLLFSSLLVDWMMSAEIWTNTQSVQDKTLAWIRRQSAFPVSQEIARSSDSGQR